MEKFSISLTTFGFKTKPTRDDWSKKGFINFERKEIDLNEFKNYLEQGYSYLGVFQLNHFDSFITKKNYYLGTFFISIDIDNSPIKFNTALAKIGIDLLPTLAYETFSSINGNRFRFIYVFDKMIEGAENVINCGHHLCELISDRLGIKISNDGIDKVSYSPYQTINGTNKQVINFNKIYNFDSFNFNDIIVSYTGNPLTDDSSLTNIVGFGEQFENEEFKNDFMSGMRYGDLFEKYKKTFINQEHSKLNYNINDAMIELPDDYYEIYRWWKKSEDGNAIRIKNHQHRRNRLLTNLKIRLLINSKLTFDDLMFDLCYEMYFYIDNTDETDKISRKDLIGIAVNALKEQKEGFKGFNYKSYRKRMVNNKYAQKHHMTRREVANKANAKRHKEQKEKFYKEVIEPYYNSNLTDKENIQAIEEITGRKISKGTLWRYKQYIKECVPVPESINNDSNKINDNINYDSLFNLDSYSYITYIPCTGNPSTDDSPLTNIVGFGEQFEADIIPTIDESEMIEENNFKLKIA